MATTIAIVAAGAVAAGAATSAAGASKGKGGSAPGPGQLPRYQKLFDRDMYQLLNEERSVLENAIAQSNFMEPEAYRLLGFEPIYDDRPNADIKTLSDKVDSIQGKIDAFKTEKFSAKGKGKQKQRRKAKRQIKKLQLERELAQEQLSSAQTTPRRITGFRKLSDTEKATALDPTQSRDGLFREAFETQNEALMRALRGEEPVDPTLRHAFDEKENLLREKLRRQFGPDYELTTFGAETMANFDRERGEAFKQYNQETIRDYSELTNRRAAFLSELTGARLGQMFLPANQAAEIGSRLLASIPARLGIKEAELDERKFQFAGAVKESELEAARAARKAEALKSIGSSITQFGSALGSAGAGGGGGGGGLGSLLGGGGSTTGATQFASQYSITGSPGRAEALSRYVGGY